MTLAEKMDQALALVPISYPKRSELVTELNDLKAGEPTAEDVIECLSYYLGALAGVGWKRKIAELLEA